MLTHCVEAPLGVRDRSNSARAATTCGMERNSDPERSKQCSAALPAAVEAHVDRRDFVPRRSIFAGPLPIVRGTFGRYRTMSRYHQCTSDGNRNTLFHNRELFHNRAPTGTTGLSSDCRGSATFYIQRMSGECSASALCAAAPVSTYTASIDTSARVEQRLEAETHHGSTCENDSI